MKQAVVLFAAACIQIVVVLTAGECGICSPDAELDSAETLLLQTSAVQFPSTDALDGSNASDASHLLQTIGVFQDPELLRKAMGVKLNERGDLPVFLYSLLTNVSLLAVLTLIFSIMRYICPVMYQNNAIRKEEGGLETAPFLPSNSIFGWYTAASNMDFFTIKQSAGLDRALLIEFARLSKNLMWTVGTPLVLILCPLHFFFGNGMAEQVGDRLSTVGINNVERGSWLFWVHALFAWYVVLISQHFLHEAMNMFLHERFQWLRELEPPRSTTVLVEGIPAKHCTDAALKQCFENLFPQKVKTASVVKFTAGLESIMVAVLDKQAELEMARSKAYPPMSEETDSECNPPLVNEHQDIERLQRELESLLCQVKKERDRIEVDGKDARKTARGCAVNTSTGFVTFVAEKEAQMALGLRLSAPVEELLMSIPPGPQDIIWSDLWVSLPMQKLWKFIGLCLIFVVFWSFLPFIMTISSFCNLRQWEAKLPFFAKVAARWPTLEVLVEGVVAQLALQIFMSFLPTVLMQIFYAFFSLKAHAWAQLHLQTWYFWFMVVFVVLVSSIGRGLIPRTLEILSQPTHTIATVAENLPSVSNFYLGYILVRWTSHGLDITRYIQVIKYLCWRAVYKPAQAVEMAEPENQDYYGIGARSARWSIDMMIGIVFCAINPLITVLVYINFALSTVLYSYLSVFAETKKHDLGGYFFEQQLLHLQVAILLFAVLMSALFFRLVTSPLLMLFVSLTVPYTLWCYRDLFNLIKWDTIPYLEVVSEESGNRCHLLKERASYEQPILQDSTDECCANLMQKRRNTSTAWVKKIMSRADL